VIAQGVTLDTILRLQQEQGRKQDYLIEQIKELHNLMKNQGRNVVPQATTENMKETIAKWKAFHSKSEQILQRIEDVNNQEASSRLQRANAFSALLFYSGLHFVIFLFVNIFHKKIVFQKKTKKKM